MRHAISALMNRRNLLKTAGVGFSSLLLGKQLAFADTGTKNSILEEFQIKDPEKFAEAMQSIRQEMKADSYRPGYHFLPPRGWFNDPNGPIYYKGQYHLFYQFEPRPEAKKLMPKCWGHAVSDDLVHWKDLPIALWPDTPHDKKGVLSGNTFIDDEGVPCAIYTALAKGGGVFTNQYKYGVLARSNDDMLTWRKKLVMDKAPYEGTPTHHDAQIWKEDGVWYQLIGGTWKGQGAAVLWSSPDLESWTYCNRIFTCEGYGPYWELPYLLPFGNKHVLLYGPGRYWVGHYDKKNYKFTPDDSTPKLLDYGGAMYAPNCHLVDNKSSDGSQRRFALGWIRQGSPSANVPYWEGLMWLPRVMTLNGDRLEQEVPAEFEVLRDEHQRMVNLELNSNENKLLPNINGDQLEINIKYDLTKTSARKFGVRLRMSEDREEYAQVYYDRDKDRFGIEGKIDFGTDHRGRIRRASQGPAYAKDNHTLSMRIFLDRSLLEVFVNGQSQTKRIFPKQLGRSVSVFTENGKAQVESIDAWTMKNIW